MDGWPVDLARWPAFGAGIGLLGSGSALTSWWIGGKMTPRVLLPVLQMINNTELFHTLLAKGEIRLRAGPLFDVIPKPLPAGFDFGRIEGMMLGLAVGDALGNTTESWNPWERRARHGEIRDYLPNWQSGERTGLPSDDTQLAFWTLEQLLADGGLIPANLAARFCRERIFGIGATVRGFIRNCTSGVPWYRCGPRSAGNGALMRIAPLVIPHLKAPSPALWCDVALAAMLTHNDSGSTAACLAYVSILWHLLHLSTPPEPAWWPRTYVAVARGLEEDTYRPRGGAFPGFSGPIWRFVEDALEAAFSRGLSVLEACGLWNSGAYLLETVPSVLYILMRHAHDPEEAIVRAVNDTFDNDTIAAVVGAAVGALHGRENLPPRWLQGLTGRTGAHDDGRVFELLDAARERWGQQGNLPGAGPAGKDS